MQSTVVKGDKPLPQMELLRADGFLPERKVQWLIVRLISGRLQDLFCTSSVP